MIRLVKEISSAQRYWRNDERIMRWTRQNELLSEADQKQWLETIAKGPTIQMFGVLYIPDRLVEEREMVGTCGLTSISMIHRTAEFSLLIGPEYQNKGYGREALTALLTYGFDNLGLDCIWGETFDGNPAMKLFESLGFTVEGKLRSRYYKAGKRIGTTIFSMLREEWN